MKVYTITCHDVYNHGASLQAYALMKYLMNCGHNVEIIDYKPNYLNNHYKLCKIDNPKWMKNTIMKFVYLAFKLPSRIIGLQRKKAFDKFTSTYLNLTGVRFVSNRDLRENLPDGDIYFCGSDQIWNSLYENGRDPAFYLDFVPENRTKVSYAASFAIDDLPTETKSFVQRKVKRLDKLSVREKSGIGILKDMDIRNAVSVVDPTLLLNRKDWNNIGKKMFKGNYILIYDFDHSPLIKKLALEISKKNNWKIYSINPGKFKYTDKNFKNVGPETFISLVRDASFVISNSYHAAIFSVIYRKNFAIVNRNEFINTRMRDFLDELGLKEKLINEYYDLEELLIPINYQDSEKFLTEKITFSKQYLYDILQIEYGMRNNL